MTSYFGESRDTVYCALEKEVLHMCLSRILSSKFRDAALKNLNEPDWNLIIIAFLMAGFLHCNFKDFC